MPHALASSALLLLSLPHGRAFSLFGHAASEYGRPRAVSGLGNSRWACAARDVRLCDTAGVSELESLLANVDVEADAHDEAGEVLEPPAPAPPPVDMLEGMTEGTWEITESGGVHSLRVAVAGKVIRFESGKMARLASGAVSVTSGQTNVFCAATLDRRNPPRPIDFTPLRVDYSERSSAAGRSPGGYIKRDGRPSDHETLVARLIDRPIRPLITTGWSLETQLATYVLAYDGRTVPDVLGICAASAALALSEVPFPKPVAGVRVAQVNGQLVVNPTAAEQAIATLDLVVAGTKDAVMMVEGAAAFVPEATVVEALELGLAAIGVLASAIGEWRAAGAGLPVYAPGFLPPSTQVYGFLERFQVDGAPLPSAYRQAMIGGTKEQRERNCVDLQARVVEMLLGGGKAGAAEQREMPAEALAGGDAGGGGTDEEDEDSGPTAAEGKGEAEVLGPASSFEEAEVRGALKKLACVTMRQIVEETGERTDGRSTDEVRPITIEMSPLPPSVHGSVLFTRGETQSLGTTTLGDNSMAQRYENLQGEQSKRFYLQYAFPPFSVGEVGRIGSPGRREVGHGNLAERALRAAVPSKEAFPYVIRTESLITESCGSSSMASVCAGCLSMLGAGVPLSSMVAGVAMGLLLDETGGGGEPIILTDILGSEDALGTMDFKVGAPVHSQQPCGNHRGSEGAARDLLGVVVRVARMPPPPHPRARRPSQVAGDEKGISAFQLDIKCEGLSIDLMRKALEQVGACAFGRGVGHCTTSAHHCTPAAPMHTSQHGA